MYSIENNTHNYLEYVWFLMYLTIIFVLLMYNHCQRPCFFDTSWTYMYLFECYKFQKVSIPSFVICIYEIFINSKIACMEFINLIEDANRIDVWTLDQLNEGCKVQWHTLVYPKVHANLMFFDVGMCLSKCMLPYISPYGSIGTMNDCMTCFMISKYMCNSYKH